MKNIRQQLMLVLAILFFNAAALAQTVDTVTISGSVTFESGKALNMAVVIFPYEEGARSYSADVKANGTFSFRIPVSGISLYEMHFNSYSRTFLLSPTEPAIGFVIKVSASGVGMGPFNSLENQAYDLFKNINNGLKDNLKKFSEGCTNDPPTCAAELNKNIAIVNNGMESIHQQFPGTFTGDVLSLMGRVTELDASQPALPQLRKHFFDHVDWSDKRVYLTTDLVGRVTSYMDYFADTSAKGRLIFINKLYDQTKGNKEAQKELTHLLYTNFVPFNREAYIQTFVNWMEGHPEFEEEQPVMFAKIKLIEKVLPGNTVTEVTGLDLNDKTQSLFTTIKRGKLTMLIFWDTDCGHCRQAMPEFSRLYAKYHPAGLNLFAAALDTEREKWKQYVTANKQDFISVMLPDKHTANRDYDILYTPTVVLINSKSNIIHRFVNVEDLERYIEEALEKNK